MHPAYSVIFFTTASGAGYGMMVWLPVLLGLGWIPTDRYFGLTGFAIAFGLVTAGLLSSTFHLGRPERAWRALSQWRSSWLSREGVVAILTYIPTGLFGLAWVFLDEINLGLGLLGAALCLITVYCTAMIYASLKTIHAWCNAWTIAGYMAFAMMTSALAVNALDQLWRFGETTRFGPLVLIALAIGYAVKLGYWRYIDTTRSASDAGTATGLGGLGKVQLFEGPHTEENYLNKEMGFRVARKHAKRLRRIARLLAFELPSLLIILSLTTPGPIGSTAAVIAFILGAIGIVVERWLFFAEAKHVVNLYYGATTA